MYVFCINGYIRAQSSLINKETSRKIFALIHELRYLCARCRAVTSRADNVTAVDGTGENIKRLISRRTSTSVYGERDLAVRVSLAMASTVNLRAIRASGITRR